MLPATPSDNAEKGAQSAGPFRVALEYGIDGDLRYISHHDEVRMLSRAITRAGWPLRYSQGFNPQPQIVVLVPRSVGCASECQCALVRLRAARQPTELFTSLVKALPADCTLRQIIAPVSRGTPQAQQVCYQVALQPLDAAGIGPRIRRLAALPELVIMRDFGPDKPSRQVDIRPYIDSIESDGRLLRMQLRCQAQRTARPSEIITELGLTAEQYNHRLRRVGITWDTELAGPTAGLARVERTKLGQAEKEEVGQSQADQEGS